MTKLLDGWMLHLILVIPCVLLHDIFFIVSDWLTHSYFFFSSGIGQLRHWEGKWKWRTHCYFLPPCKLSNWKWGCHGTNQGRRRLQVKSLPLGIHPRTCYWHCGCFSTLLFVGGFDLSVALLRLWVLWTSLFSCLLVFDAVLEKIPT